MQRQVDLDRFYALLNELEKRIGGRRRLGDCDGRMDWSARGVYFFFEDGEMRDSAANCPRVVRVGTHALTVGSKTSLWNRISQHRGSLSPRGGNHRGSIFRLLVGEAMYRRDPSLLIESWGRGSSASRDIKDRERALEERVSEYLGAMTLIFLSIPDDPSPESMRGVIERNSIALLSSYTNPAPDQSSKTWLGNFSGRENVRRSGLWNNNHVEESYEKRFLNLLELNISKFHKI